MPIAAATRCARAAEAEHVAVALVLDDASTVGAHVRATQAPVALQHVEPGRVAERDRELGRHSMSLNTTVSVPGSSLDAEHLRARSSTTASATTSIDECAVPRATANSVCGRGARRGPRLADLDARVADHDDGARAAAVGSSNGDAVEGRAVGAPEIGDDHGVVGPGLERDVAARDAGVDHDDAVRLPPELEPPVEHERERLTVRRADGGDGMVHAAPAWQAGTLPDSTQMLIL